MDTRVNEVQQSSTSTSSSTQTITSKITTNDLPDEILIECRGAKKSEGQSYEANEHTDIGNFAFSLFLESLKDAKLKEIIKTITKPVEKEKKYKLYDPRPKEGKDTGEFVDKDMYYFSINDEINLTPGEIVALAGDFFADAENPISFGKSPEDQEERFKNAYNSLINATNRIGLSKLVKHIRDDAEGVNVHSHWSVRFKKVVKDKLDINNVEYAIESAKENTLSGFWHSPYFKMALTNFDHFGNEARVAFLAGHRVAIKSAQQAEREGDHDKKKALLQDAFLQELFACHFLTDLFAAGHVRTPRKEILNYLMQDPANPGAAVDITKAIPDLSKVSDLDLTIAGFLARKMHDEDGDRGVSVKLDGVNLWDAYGDGNYYRPENAYNATKACNVVIAALNDLVLAFNRETSKIKLLDDNQLATYVPISDEQKNKTEERVPLFFVENNQVKCRGDVNCTHLNLALLSHGFFKVKISQAKTTVTQTAANVQETVTTMKEVATTKITNAQEKIAQSTQDLYYETQEQLESLRNALVATNARCTIL